MVLERKGKRRGNEGEQHGEQHEGEATREVDTDSVPVLSLRAGKETEESCTTMASVPVLYTKPYSNHGGRSSLTFPEPPRLVRR